MSIGLFPLALFIDKGGEGFPWSAKKNWCPTCLFSKHKVHFWRNAPMQKVMFYSQSLSPRVNVAGRNWTGTFYATPLKSVVLRKVTDFQVKFNHNWPRLPREQLIRRQTRDDPTRSQPQPCLHFGQIMTSWSQDHLALPHLGRWTRWSDSITLGPPHRYGY